jgi:hypothetical protein
MDDFGVTLGQTDVHGLLLAGFGIFSWSSTPRR